MPACPQCTRNIASDAISCPHCQLTLKAHGHSGIDLYRADGDTPLCASCTYDADDSCNFPNRPHATSCTLYHNSQTQPELKPQEIYRIPWQRKREVRLAIALLLILTVIVISLQ